MPMRPLASLLTRTTCSGQIRCPLFRLQSRSIFAGISSPCRRLSVAIGDSLFTSSRGGINVHSKLRLHPPGRTPLCCNNQPSRVSFASGVSFTKRDTKANPRQPAKKKKSQQSTAPSNHNLIRLSKRMSELDICSRREADRFIQEGRVLLHGSPVARILGQKVPFDETEIVLLNGKNTTTNNEVMTSPLEFSWPQLQTAAVVLHKPVGYISGQPEGAKKHVPAVRLLTKTNAHIVRSTYSNDDNEEFRHAQSIVQDSLSFQWHHPTKSQEPTLEGYVPAGRLDLESSGLIIFTKNGVMAKKLISGGTRIEKEYYVLVEPLQGLTRYEQAAGMTWANLPRQPHRNLDRMRRGGFRLFGDDGKPLRRVVAAEWIHPEEQPFYFTNHNNNTDHHRRHVLRLVLTEGRKHQIRRMCREMLGMHVLQLVRTRIGSIELGSLPEGKWRPLRQEEARMIHQSG